MPAISADTVALPRIPAVDPTAADRPVTSVTTAPSGFEGEGFPVRRAFAGVDLATLDPFVHMDQMGEVEYAPGRAQGHPLASAPRVRNRDLHDRWHLPAPGLQRGRRVHHRRRHAVDDSGIVNLLAADLENSRRRSGQHGYAVRRRRLSRTHPGHILPPLNFIPQRRGGDRRGLAARGLRRRERRAAPDAQARALGIPNAWNREASWKPMMTWIPSSATTSTMTP